MRTLDDPGWLQAWREYDRILRRIFEADTREELIALQRDIVTLEGGRWARDFVEFWYKSGWQRLFPDEHPPPYPPGGPLCDLFKRNLH